MEAEALPPETKSPLHAAEVMRRLGYVNRTSFWQMVWREGLPCTRLTRTNIIFDEDELNAWLEARKNRRA